MLSLWFWTLSVGATAPTPVPCTAMIATYQASKHEVAEMPVVGATVGLRQVVLGFSKPLGIGPATRLARKVREVTLRDAITGEPCGIGREARGVPEMPYRWKRFSEWIVWQWGTREVPELVYEPPSHGTRAWLVMPEHPEGLLEVELVASDGKASWYVPVRDPVLNEVPAGVPLLDEDGQILGLHDGGSTATGSFLLRWSVGDALSRARISGARLPILRELPRAPGGSSAVDREREAQQRLVDFLGTSTGSERLARLFPPVSDVRPVTDPSRLVGFTIGEDLPVIEAIPYYCSLAGFPQKSLQGCTAIAVVDALGRVQEVETNGCGATFDIDRFLRACRWRPRDVQGPSRVLVEVKSRR